MDPPAARVYRWLRRQLSAAQRTSPSDFDPEAVRHTFDQVNRLFGDGRLGAEIGGATPEQVAALDAFGEVAGLAFQVVDDVLDVTASSTELGKTGGKDAAAGKATFPAALGLDGARRRAEELTRSAISLVESIELPPGGDRRPLESLTHFILERTS